MRNQVEVLRWLNHGIGELEDAVRRYREVYDMILEDPTIDDVVARVEKTGDTSVMTAQRYLEKSKKLRD